MAIEKGGSRYDMLRAQREAEFERRQPRPVTRSVQPVVSTRQQPVVSTSSECPVCAARRAARAAAQARYRAKKAEGK